MLPQKCNPMTVHPGLPRPACKHHALRQAMQMGYLSFTLYTRKNLRQSFCTKLVYGPLQGARWGGREGVEQHVCVCAFVDFLYACIYVFTVCMHLCVCTCVNTNVLYNIHPHAYPHRAIQKTNMHKCMCIDTHTYIQTYMRTYINTHIHTHE